MGVQGPPWYVTKVPEKYQFYSVFSTENKSRVDTSLKFQFRLQQGDQWGSLGPLGGMGVAKEPNNIRY